MPSRGTVFIQPHSDDTVMSSYFLIKVAALPKPYYLCTMFGRSNWIDPIQRKKKYKQDDTSQVTRIRKTEDQKFADLLGLKLLFLNLEDCLLRNGEAFYAPAKKLDQHLLKQVRARIITLTDKYKIKNIVAPFPFGIRQHYDHRIVCEAVKFMPNNLYNRFFVDDIPYSRIANYRKYNLHLFTKTKGNISDKFKTMKVYDSQMCKLFFNNVRRISEQNHGYERLFSLTKQ